MAERRSLTAGILDLVANRFERRRAERAAKHAPPPEPPRMQAQTIGYFGSSRSSGAKWRGGQSTASPGRTWDHWRTRQQARDITEDSIHAYGLVHRRADTIVDTGLRLEPTPRAAILGMSEEQADAWAQAVRESFDAWCRARVQHRSGMLSFYEVQHQLEVADTRDNDEFVRLYYSGRADLLNPLQFEVIDPNQIRGDALTSTLLVTRGADGIVRGPDGSERSYRIWVASDPERPGQYTEVTIPRVGEKSGRLMMLHGFRPEYAGQGRGYSRLGVSMQEFENLEDYILSIIKKAINQSQLVLAVENPKNPPSNPFENLGQPPAGPAGPLSSSGSGSAPVIVDHAVNVTPLEEAAFEVPGSTAVASLAEGDQIKILGNAVPGPEFDSTLDAILTPLLAAHGLSLDLYKIKFVDSYSAARAGLAVVWRRVVMDRAWLDSAFIAPSYEMWLAGEIAGGRVSCPGWADPRLRAAWTAHEVIGTPPVQIDPAKEASAAKDYLEMSATTIERVTHEHGGGNAAANIARNKRTFAVLPPVPWGTAKKAEAQMEPEGPPSGSNGKARPRLPVSVR